MMPSVDRVGRPFPLTIAVMLTSDADAAYALFHGAEWFARVEDAALGMLDETRGPDDLDQSLEDSPFGTATPAEAFDGSVGALRTVAAIDDFGVLAEASALRAWSAHVGWKGLWWTRGRVGECALMLATAG